MQSHNNHGKNRTDANQILEQRMGGTAHNIEHFFHHGVVLLWLGLFYGYFVPYMFLFYKNFMGTNANKMPPNHLTH